MASPSTALPLDCLGASGGSALPQRLSRQQTSKRRLLLLQWPPVPMVSAEWTFAQSMEQTQHPERLLPRPPLGAHAPARSHPRYALPHRLNERRLPQRPPCRRRCALCLKPWAPPQRLHKREYPWRQRFPPSSAGFLLRPPLVLRLPLLMPSYSIASSLLLLLLLMSLSSFWRMPSPGR